MIQYQFKLYCLANSAADLLKFLLWGDLLTTSMEKLNNRDKNHITERQMSRLWPHFFFILI